MRCSMVVSLHYPIFSGSFGTAQVCVVTNASIRSPPAAHHGLKAHHGSELLISKQLLGLRSGCSKPRRLRVQVYIYVHLCVYLCIQFIRLHCAVRYTHLRSSFLLTVPHFLVPRLLLPCVVGDLCSHSFIATPTATQLVYCVCAIHQRGCQC
jgi:hypothetical protein